MSIYNSPTTKTYQNMVCCSFTSLRINGEPGHISGAPEKCGTARPGGRCDCAWILGSLSTG